jgi:hypothetical protein
MIQISISVLLIFFTESETFKVKNINILTIIKINNYIHYKNYKLNNILL